MKDTIIIENLKEDQQFIVGDHEEKTFVIFLDNKQNQSGEIIIKIKGRQANIQILGIIIGSGQQKIKLATIQDHQYPESKSNLLIKSVLFDEARLFYRGLIKIEKNAQKSNAYQKNQTLLMGTGVWADSKPYLEILTNDVRCTHGATIGKIDENLLYYLQTRGLDEKTSTKLITVGFLQEVIDRIPDQKVQNTLAQKIDFQVNKLL